MARWYSKNRKARYSWDLRKYGGIPSYAWFRMQSPLDGLEPCEFDDECEFCSRPRGGSYASISGYYEVEVDYYICGHCAKKRFPKHQILKDMSYVPWSKFNIWKRKNNLKPGQQYCEYCETVTEGECRCSASFYNKTHSHDTAEMFS
jgi:hypothetical protein